MESSPIPKGSIPGPINLASWLETNSNDLKPPVNNKCLYSGKDFILMAVGGPNTRNDYHVNEKEEWFYQIKGDMLLKIIDDGEFRDVIIREGETFLVPGKTPHSPRRTADTIGLVMESARPPTSIDRMRWYCENSEAHQNEPTIIREVSFHCENIEAQVKAIVDEWMNNEAGRKCGICGEIAPSH